MAGKAPVSVTLTLVDKATAPLRAFSASVKKTFEPFRKAKNTLKLTASEMGLPKIKSAFTGIGKAAGGTIGHVKSLAKELAILGGLGAGFLSGIAVTTASAGDAAYKTAQMVGVSTESWTKLAYAADMSGVSADTLKSGLTRLNKQITDAAKGNKNAAYWFRSLGISIRDQNGELKTADTVMSEAAAKLAGMENGSVKTRLAMELFGKAAGPQMIPLLNSGKDGIDALMEEAERLGLVFTDGQGQASESFMDSLARVKSAVVGVSYAIGNQLVPVMEPLLKWIESIIVANRELIAGQVREWLASFQAALPDIIAGVKSFWENLVSLGEKVSGIVADFGGWAEVLPVVGTALLAVKLAPLILSIGLLAKAFLGLGVAIMTTPIGWIIAGIAALAGAVYMIYTHWDAVLEYFGNIFKRIKAAFDDGLIAGITAVLLEFQPHIFFIKAFDAVLEYFTGFSLLDAGARIVTSLWDGMKSVWGDVVGWLRESVSSLTDWMPDFVKNQLGLNVSMPEVKLPQMQPTSQPAGYGPPVGIRSMMQQDSARAATGREAKITLESRNLPGNMQVTTQGVDRQIQYQDPLGEVYGGTMGASL